MKDLFEKFRHDPKTHLGLGDIRLTVGAQEEIMEEIKNAIVMAKYDGLLQGKYLSYAIMEEISQKGMNEIMDIRERKRALPAPKGE